MRIVEAQKLWLEIFGDRLELGVGAVARADLGSGPERTAVAVVC